MKQKRNEGRRKFISQGLASGASIFTTGLGKKNEEITLLTPDGKLVKVDKKIIDPIKKGTKATNIEILKWTGKA